MKSRKHTFAPSLDGRLEDRLVLNAATGAVIAQQHGYGGHNGGYGDNQGNFPREAILTTRTYNSILVNVHRATEQLARSNGSDAAYNRAADQIIQQLSRLPYANQNGLVDAVTSSIGYYGTNETRELYSDIRSTAISYLDDQVGSGYVAISKSHGHYFSDADILGFQGTPGNLPAQGGGGYYNGHNNNGGQGNFPREAILTSRTYNSILVNIHRATEQLARSNGNDAAYNRAVGQIDKQLTRLPYANQNGLIDYVNESILYYGTNETRELYSDIRSTVVSYLGDQVGSGEVAISKSPGHYFSDADIIGPNALIYNQVMPV
jgi:hypothetical protein